MGIIKLNGDNYSGAGGSGSGGHTIIDPTGAEVTQEPKMQFIGKVNVSDDSTNQKTVVNMPAEVVPITRAEYEALPDTKLNDDIAYFITDGSSAKVQGYPPLIYSKYEREIGCWLNGKPLYRKTFSISAQSNTISTSLLNNLDIQFVTNLYLIVWQSNNFYVDFVNIKWNSNTKSLILPSTSVFVLALVVEYTKTTDTAGSGIWNGQGGLAHHYSTSEKIIGTWIDGKPLYERTKVVPFANFTHNNDTYFTPIASDNTETLRNVEAIAYSTGYGICTLGGRAYSRDNTLSYYWELVEYYSNVALHFIGESATDVGVTEVVITYQYTKTTD